MVSFKEFCALFVIVTNSASMLPFCDSVHEFHIAVIPRGSLLEINNCPIYFDMANLFEFILFGVELLLIVGDLQQRFDLGEQSPPLPVPQLQVRCTVSLDDLDGIQLLQTLLEVPKIQIISTYN